MKDINHDEFRVIYDATGLSARKVAKFLHCSNTAVSNWLNRKHPISHLAQREINRLKKKLRKEGAL